MDLFGENRKIGREQRAFLGRVAVLALVGAMAVGVLVARISYLTVVKGEGLFEQSEHNYQRREVIPAPRGAISDRHGRVLAASEARYNVLVSPFKIGEEQLAETLRAVARFYVGTEPPAVEEVMALSPLSKGAILASNRTLDEVTPLLERQALLPGVLVEQTFLRIYPFGREAGQITGYVGPIPPRDMPRRLGEGYGLDDDIGLMGLEAKFEDILKGKKGREDVYRDAEGRLMTPEVSVEEAERGGEMTLTLDIELQRFVGGLLKEKPGAAVVMDPRNGEILAMVSSPDFDANEPARASLDGNSSYNKALRGGYAPGSTFKIVTAAAALLENGMDPNRKIVCDKYYQIGRKRMSCLAYHGALDMKTAIERSCNVYFYTLAGELSLSQLLTTAEAFGFGQPTGIALRASGHAGKLGYSSPASRPMLVDRVMMGIGQGHLILVTPLQMAVAYSTFANGGTRYPARIVSWEKSSDPRLQARQSFMEPQKALNFSKAQHGAIMAGFRAVVEARWGTGRHGEFDPAMRVAGKTGTAETGVPGVTHAWFVGFSPWDAPEVCVSVILEKAGHGGEAAAPVVRRILEEYYRLKDLRKLKKPSLSD